MATRIDCTNPDCPNSWHRTAVCPRTSLSKAGVEKFELAAQSLVDSWEDAGPESGSAEWLPDLTSARSRELAAQGPGEDDWLRDTYGRPVPDLTDENVDSIVESIRNPFFYEEEEKGPIERNDSGQLTSTTRVVKRPLGSYYEQVTDAQTFSGHKLHITASNAEEAEEAFRRVAPLLVPYGLGCKVATENLREFRSEDKASRKAVTIYLPRGATAERDTAAVTEAVGAYESTAPPLEGQAKVSSSVYHRYDQNQDHGHDVDYATYKRHYKDA